jgi:phage terminase small subunit
MKRGCSDRKTDQPPLPQPLNTQLSTINSSPDLQRHAPDEKIPVREEASAQVTAEEMQTVVESPKHAHQRRGYFHRELPMLRRVEDKRRVKDGEAERRKNLNEKQNRCSLWGVAEKTIA